MKRFLKLLMHLYGMSLFSQLKSHYTHLLVNWKFCGLGEEATIIKILLTDRRQTTCSKYLFCVLVKMSLLEVGITGVLSCSHPLRHTADTGNISEMNKFNDNKFTTTRWCKFLWHLGVGGFLVLPFFGRHASQLNLTWLSSLFYWSGLNWLRSRTVHQLSYLHANEQQSG